MKGYVKDIGQATKENNNFRQVVYTAKYCQLVLMSLKPGEEIGEEVHETVDQFFRFEEGECKVVLDGVEHKIEAEYAVLVPAGTKHNIINTGATPLKLYTIYTPPEHKDGTIHITKAEALADEHDHFEA